MQRRRKRSDGCTRERKIRSGGSPIPDLAGNCAHQLKVEISEAKHLSSHAICIQRRVNSKALEHYVSSASGIMQILMKTMKTKNSGPIRQARCAFWPFEVQLLHQYLYRQLLKDSSD